MTNWLGARRSRYPTVPEVGRLQELRSLCRRKRRVRLGLPVAQSWVRVITLPGGHHFDGDYAQIARSCSPPSRHRWPPEERMTLGPSSLLSPLRVFRPPRNRSPSAASTSTSPLRAAETHRRARERGRRWTHLAPECAAILAAKGYFVVGLDTKHTCPRSRGAVRPSVPRTWPATQIARRLRGRGCAEEARAGRVSEAPARRARRLRPRGQGRGAGGRGPGLPDRTSWAGACDSLIYLRTRRPMSRASRPQKWWCGWPPPLAQLHSTHDEYVPLEEARRVYDQAGAPSACGSSTRATIGSRARRRSSPHGSSKPWIGWRRWTTESSVSSPLRASSPSPGTTRPCPERRADLGGRPGDPRGHR